MIPVLFKRMFGEEGIKSIVGTSCPNAYLVKNALCGNNKNFTGFKYAEILKNKKYFFYLVKFWISFF